MEISLPDIAQDFAANTFTAARLVGQNALRRRQHGNTDATDNGRDVFLADIHTAARFADTLQPGYKRLIIYRIFERNAQNALFLVFNNL